MAGGPGLGSGCHDGTRIASELTLHFEKAPQDHLVEERHVGEKPSSWSSGRAKDRRGWWSEEQGTGDSQGSEEPWESGHLGHPSPNHHGCPGQGPPVRYGLRAALDSEKAGVKETVKEAFHVDVAKRKGTRWIKPGRRVRLELRSGRQAHAEPIT